MAKQFELGPKHIFLASSGLGLLALAMQNPALGIFLISTLGLLWDRIMPYIRALWEGKNGPIYAFDPNLVVKQLRKTGKYNETIDALSKLSGLPKNKVAEKLPQFIERVAKTYQSTQDPVAAIREGVNQISPMGGLFSIIGNPVVAKGPLYGLAAYGIKRPFSIKSLYPTLTASEYTKRLTGILKYPASFASHPGKATMVPENLRNFLSKQLGVQNIETEAARMKTFLEPAAVKYKNILEGLENFSKGEINKGLQTRADDILKNVSKWFKKYYGREITTEEAGQLLKNVPRIGLETTEGFFRKLLRRGLKGRGLIFPVLGLGAGLIASKIQRQKMLEEAGKRLTDFLNKMYSEGFQP